MSKYASDSNVPVVYGEPVREEVDTREYIFERETDELLRVVNAHADHKAGMKKREKLRHHRCLCIVINIVYLVAIAFLVAVGIQSCLGTLQ